MASVDWQSVQHGLARVWRHCWEPQVQDGDLMSRGGANEWECPWCRYSLAFWPADRRCAEGMAQDHLIQEHERELRDLVLRDWRLPG